MLNDPETPTAYHEAGHVVLALALDWQVGDISLRAVQTAPRDDQYDPVEAAMVTLGGDASLWVKYERERSMEKGSVVRPDPLLGRIADAVRSNDFKKLSGHTRTDTVDAIGWLLCEAPGSTNEDLIKRYRVLEKEARQVVRDRWGEVVEIAHLLLKYGLLTPRQRRWLCY